MIPRWLLLVVGLLLAFAASPAAAKGDNPKVSSTEFDSPPSDLFYFDSSNTIVWRDPLKQNALISFDGGNEWEVIKGVDGDMEGQVAVIWRHPHDKEHRAYALSEGTTHWVTTDQGKTWKPFTTGVQPILKLGRSAPLMFSGWDPKKVIFHGKDCSSFPCIRVTIYTTDDFKTHNTLEGAFMSCLWAAGTPEFGHDVDLLDTVRDRVICVSPGMRSPFDMTERLVYSDNYFRDDAHGTEINLDRGRPVSGRQILIRSVKKYLVVGLQSASTIEQALYVSDDSHEWHRVEFGGHRIEEDAYTLLESTNYSLQVDVQTTWNSNRMGVLFTSNSNGTYFTPNIEHTNRDKEGFVDFEKVTDIQGIVIVNTVDNWKEALESDRAEKKVVTDISFDDGRTFQHLKVGDDRLHLHSMTTYDALRELPTLRRMFSSPAPGLVMGVGNTGDHLKDYKDGDLYVSDDAGLTWRYALKGPHHFEFGDQGGVIVAVTGEGKTKEVQYSLNHGKEWEKPIELKEAIKPMYLTTTPDATSLKFMLVGATAKGVVVYSIDFDGLHERKCTDDDIKPWIARKNEKGEADCLMGHKQIYQRRDPDADCFMKKEFKMKPPSFERCKCSAEDFECDYNFKLSEDGKECVPAVPLTPPAGQCKNPSDTYKGPSGWRLIPGNVCIREGGKNLDKDIERSCGDSTGSPPPIADGKVRAGEPQYFSVTGMSTNNYKEYFYLERQTSNQGDDETIFMLTNKKELYVTQDHGMTWEQPKALKDEDIVAIAPHPYYVDGAYFLTSGYDGWSTVNRGASFDKFKKPTKSMSMYTSPLSFHEDHIDWMIWVGNDQCEGSSCTYTAWYTKNRGDEWHKMLRGVDQCQFGYHEGRENSEALILCEQYFEEDRKNNRQLVSSNSKDDWFANTEVINDNIAHFVTMNEFFVVATFPTEKHKFLNVSTSMDGQTFAQAHFPINVDVNQYTALPGSNYALFLQVVINTEKGRSYGSLVKSNSNGTYFTLSLQALNVNDYGYVDFEKMAGLEGVALANVVGNVKDVQDKGASKKLRSMITHNDGGQWALLAPPMEDAEGKKYGCSVTKGRGTEKCSLHLHGYTERRDARDTFYSGSAIGMLIGVGNVGAYLGSADEADTFLSRDGGVTWKNVKKGRYMFEYGDAGSLIVLVRELQPTKVVHYSLDEGATWTEFQFADKEMIIDDISTVPSDTSKRFLLWGKDAGSSDNKFATISLDFSGIWDRECELDEDADESKDYYLWAPKHPALEAQGDDVCLFGHVEQYHRKKPEAQCWVNWREPHIHRVGSNCECTRADFECDFNYEMQKDGSCGLVAGLPKPDHSEQCKNDPELVEYWEPTGYRKIPQSTCEGGRRYDQVEPRPCPNKEQEFEKKHSISGVGLFFAIVIPIAVAAGIGYYVYTRWDGKFGQIRLGEGGSVTTEGLFGRNSALVAIPVAIIAGIVAVAQSLPLLATSLWRSVSGFARTRGRGYERPYNTRGSFAARRGDYTHVVDDEDELLGADEFEEEDEA
jgi:hypothetical protein